MQSQKQFGRGTNVRRDRCRAGRLRYVMAACCWPGRADRHHTPPALHIHTRYVCAGSRRPQTSHTNTALTTPPGFEGLERKPAAEVAAAAKANQLLAIVRRSFASISKMPLLLLYKALIRPISSSEAASGDHYQEEKETRRESPEEGNEASSGD